MLSKRSQLLLLLLLKGFYEEILPQYFYYVCNIPVLYWEKKTFLTQDHSGKLYKKKVHIVF